MITPSSPHDHSEFYVSILLTISTVFASALAIDIKMLILSDANVGYRHKIVMGAEGGAVLVCLLVVCRILMRGTRVTNNHILIGAAAFAPSIFLAFILDDVSRVYSYGIDYSAADIRMIIVESVLALAGLVGLAAVIHKRTRTQPTSEPPRISLDSDDLRVHRWERHNLRAGSPDHVNVVHS